MWGKEADGPDQQHVFIRRLDLVRARTVHQESSSRVESVDMDFNGSRDVVQVCYTES